MESVHHLMKVVSGAPNIRPAWFFDAVEQGEGLNDIGTHLVDLVQWTLFPEQRHRLSRGRARALGAALADGDSGSRIPACHRWSALRRQPDAVRERRRARVLRQHARVVRGARRAHQAERDLGLGSAAGRRRHALCVLSRHARAHRGPPDGGRSLSAGAVCHARVAGIAGRRCWRPRAPRSRRCRRRIQALASRSAAPKFTSPFPPRSATVTKRTSRRWRAIFSATFAIAGTLPAWERPNMLAKYLRDDHGDGIEPQVALARRRPPRPEVTVTIRLACGCPFGNPRLAHGKPQRLWFPGTPVVWQPPPCMATARSWQAAKVAVTPFTLPIKHAFLAATRGGRVS